MSIPQKEELQKALLFYKQRLGLEFEVFPGGALGLLGLYRVKGVSDIVRLLPLLGLLVIKVVRVSGT